MGETDVTDVKPIAKKIRFVSIKWKIVIVVSLILFAINGFISVITYNSLDKQFVTQQARLLKQQKNVSDKLIEQVYQRLEGFVEILSFFSDTQVGSNTIKISLDQNWPHIQILFELQGAKLIAPDGNILGTWGEKFESSTQDLFHQVIQSQLPANGFFCGTECSFYLASPILGQNGEVFVLIVSQSVAEWLLKLKSVSGANTGIISVKQFEVYSLINNPKEKILPKWRANIIGLTTAETNFDYLLELSRNIKLEIAKKQNNYLTKNSRDLNVRFLSLENENSTYPAYLVLINDITSSREQIRTGVSQAIITALLGILVTVLFIVLSTWKPIRRITTLSNSLPMLATGHFEQVKNVLSRKTSNLFIKDEIDNLGDIAIDLTGQLERLESEVIIREKALTKNALYDELTDLANRRLIMDRILHALSEHRREKTNFAVLFLDLDQFKRINDSMGHEQGDKLLTEVARRLTDCVRESDTVARLGGDEFTILLNHLDDDFNATSVAKKIMKNLKYPINLNGREIIITTSIGIAIAPENGRDPETILRNADLAMYKAKDKGRDNYHYYTESMNIEAQEFLELENDLRLAVDRHEFELYYQPQVDLKSGVIIGVEALIRWNSPKRGFVLPYVFIDALEATGLIVPLGEEIIRMACEQAYLWNEVCHHEIKVSINLSARQFNDPELESCIKKILNEKQIESKYLEMEITESMLMDDIQNAIDTMHRLKRLGLTLAIDDFGTGYSSLSYLKQFPVDVLKVDREFVKDIPFNKSDMAITSAVIAMAHKLHLKVVAEGIETEEQMEFLKSNNCEIGQGYYFGRPQPATEISILLSNVNLEELV